jgi:hypothetical protein
MFSPRLRRGAFNFYCSLTSAAEISASRQHQRGEMNAAVAHCAGARWNGA